MAAEGKANGYVPLPHFAFPRPWDDAHANGAERLACFRRIGDRVAGKRPMTAARPQSCRSLSAAWLFARRKRSGGCPTGPTWPGERPEICLAALETIGNPTPDVTAVRLLHVPAPEGDQTHLDDTRRRRNRDPAASANGLSPGTITFGNVGITYLSRNSAVCHTECHLAGTRSLASFCPKRSPFAFPIPTAMSESSGHASPDGIN